MEVHHDSCPQLEGISVLSSKDCANENSVWPVSRGPPGGDAAGPVRDAGLMDEPEQAYRGGEGEGCKRGPCEGTALDPERGRSPSPGTG